MLHRNGYYQNISLHTMKCIYIRCNQLIEIWFILLCLSLLLLLFSARSLQEFGRYLNMIEDERDRMVSWLTLYDLYDENMLIFIFSYLFLLKLGRALKSFIHPIENFRSNSLGLVKVR